MAMARTQKMVRSGQKSAATIYRNMHGSNFILMLMAKERRLSSALRRQRHRDRRLLLLLLRWRRSHLCSLARRWREQRARTMLLVAREATETLARSVREEGRGLDACNDGERQWKKRRRSGRRTASRRRGEITLDTALTSPTSCRCRPPRPLETTTTTPSS
uniref:Uncharacterized protein n=1 Tax=Oryza meridionalis TaxID=40149 RepID=A0A0E0DGY6_9ORYZ